MKVDELYKQLLQKNGVQLIPYSNEYIDSILITPLTFADRCDKELLVVATMKCEPNVDLNGSPCPQCYDLLQSPLRSTQHKYNDGLYGTDERMCRMSYPMTLDNFKAVLQRTIPFLGDGTILINDAEFNRPMGHITLNTTLYEVLNEMSSSDEKSYSSSEKKEAFEFGNNGESFNYVALIIALILIAMVMYIFLKST